MLEGGGRGKPRAAQPKKRAQCPGAAGGTGSCLGADVTRKVLGKSPASHPLLEAGNSSNSTSCGAVFSAPLKKIKKKKGCPHAQTHLP